MKNQKQTVTKQGMMIPGNVKCLNPCFGQFPKVAIQAQKRLSCALNVLKFHM